MGLCACRGRGGHGYTTPTQSSVYVYLPLPYLPLLHYCTTILSRPFVPSCSLFFVIIIIKIKTENKVRYMLYICAICYIELYYYIYTHIGGSSHSGALCVGLSECERHNVIVRFSVVCWLCFVTVICYYYHCCGRSSTVHSSGRGGHETQGKHCALQTQTRLNPSTSASSQEQTRKAGAVSVRRAAWDRPHAHAPPCHAPPCHADRVEGRACARAPLPFCTLNAMHNAWSMRLPVVQSTAINSKFHHAITRVIRSPMAKRFV